MVKLVEKFSPKNFLIIFLMHLACVPIFFNVSATNALGWAVCHLLFGTFGASLGLHRYFSHRSFKSKKSFETFVAVMGTLCLQGSVMFWASAHREHHRLNENPGDPYSAKRGFLWSHLFWLFYNNPNGYSFLTSIRNVKDLRTNSTLLFLEKYYLQVNFLFLGMLFLGCYLTNQVSLFYYIGPLRIVTVWHATWLINSYSHQASLFSGKTKLINSYIMCILIGGDGNHKSHHEKPMLLGAKSDLKFNLDYGYMVLVLLRKFKIVDFKDYDSETIKLAESG